MLAPLIVMLAVAEYTSGSSMMYVWAAARLKRAARAIKNFIVECIVYADQGLINRQKKGPKSAFLMRTGGIFFPGFIDLFLNLGLQIVVLLSSGTSPQEIEVGDYETPDPKSFPRLALSFLFLLPHSAVLQILPGLRAACMRVRFVF